MNSYTPEKLLAMFDHIPGHVAFVNATTLHYEFVNRAFEKSFSKSREKIVGSHIKDIIGEANYLFALKYIATVRKGTAITYENSFNLSSGKRWIQVNYSPVFNALGQVETIAVLSNDITERKDAEEKLLKSEQQHTAILQTAMDGFLLIDTNGRIVEVNTAYSEMSGYSQEELLTMRVSDLDANESPGEFHAYLKAVFKTGNGRFISRNRKKSGGFSDVEVSVRLLQDDGYVAAFFRDITESKHTEDLLKKNEALMRTAIENLPVIFYLIDRAGFFRLSVGAGLRRLGLEQNQMVGLSAFELYKDFPEITSALNQALAGETSSFETTAGGSSFFNVCVPSPPTSGWFDGIVAVAMDITERVHASEVLQKVQKLESLGLLAGGIAHDFNNLMGGIMGYIDLARGCTQETDSADYLEKALQTIGRAKRLTHKLLTFAKGGAPAQKVGRLFPCVEDAARFSLSGSNISCRVDIEENLSPCSFDKNQIEQVIDHIINNAMHAMPDGGNIEITARNVTLLKEQHVVLTEGRYIRISIKDCGIGIPPSMLPQIFDPFFTTKAKGHGLGLSTCYSIIKRHGGTIDVVSEQGKGSTFHIHLPAVNAAQLNESPTYEVAHCGKGTIIIMDDEAVILDTMKCMLISLGYSVKCTSDGREALKVFTEDTRANMPVTALFLDLTVPGGMGGAETVIEIRKLNAAIPVFVASGYADDPVMQEPHIHGFTSSIIKPFLKRDLAKLLSEYVPGN